MASILDIEVYANVTDPRGLSFDLSTGNLYVGRDAYFSGGGFGDPVKVHQIGAGGLSVQEYGNAAIGDPDVVAFDAVGLVSGAAGSVLVGGATGANSGQITAIWPNQSLTTVFNTPSDVDGMAFDSAGASSFRQVIFL